MVLLLAILIVAGVSTPLATLLHLQPGEAQSFTSEDDDLAVERPYAATVVSDDLVYIA